MNTDQAEHPCPSVSIRGRTAAQASYRLARNLAGDLLKRRSPGLAWRNLRGQWRARRGDFSADPHRQAIDWIMDVNERAGHQVAFYVIPENTDPRLDNRIDLDEPRLRTLLRAIHARGHEIGIHPGYNTYRHPDATARSGGDFTLLWRNSHLGADADRGCYQSLVESYPQPSDDHC